MNSQTKGNLLQRGVGLLELMLSLAIIAILLIMATRYYQSASQSQKVTQTASDIQALMAAAANYTASDPNATYSIDDLASAGLLPPKWGLATTSNAWGFGYGATNSSTSGGNIIVTVYSMPLSACNALNQMMKDGYAGGQTDAGCSGDPGNYVATFGPSGISTF